MREIKFRAWVPKEKTMIYHREVIERAHLQFEDSLCSSDLVMQYTGLKDKNGEEIFEGDICDYGYKVGFNEINGHWELQYADGTPKAFPIPSNVIIIGNIYETPELMANV